MEKTLEYYLNLPYTLELQETPGEGWFVCVKELPGCMSQGDTAPEALEMIEDAMRVWIELGLEDGEFVVRVPKSLHRRLVEQAGAEGVSLNQYINVALAGSISSQYVPVQTILKSVVMEKP